MAVHADATELKLQQPDFEPESEAPLEELPAPPKEADRDEASLDADCGARPRTSGRALQAAVAMIVALAGLLVWLGYGAYQSHRSDQRDDLFLATARQAAVDLTTVDYPKAEADVQRIVDSATGAFREDFQKRSQPFIEAVKQSQSKSQGSVIEAAVESAQADSARILVAVTVKTSLAGVAEEEPRAWRMRISVLKVGDQAKVSNVEFIA